MPSYMHTRDIKPEDLEPEKAPELSKSEKVKNWLYYMKWPLIIGALCLALVVVFIVQTVTRVQPDITIGIVSPYTYPSEFIDKFKQELEAITEDYNGDGKVSVEIETFQIILSTMNQDQEIDPQLVMAEQTRISVVHQTASPVIFIMEPSCAKFYQETFALAGNWDGTFADEDTPLSELAMRWSDVEGLANLNLDFTITDYTMEDIEITTMQDVMAEHYVSVMPLWEKQLNKEKTYKQWAASRDSLAKWAGIVIE